MNPSTSKVALCPNCGNLIKAGLVEYLDKQSEQEFTELTNEGFKVFLETPEETQARNFGSYLRCSKGECEKSKLEEL